MRIAFVINLCESGTCTELLLCFRMTKKSREQMRREFGLPTSSRAFKRLWPFIHHVEDEKLYCQMKERCMVSVFKSLFYISLEIVDLLFLPCDKPITATTLWQNNLKCGKAHIYRDTNYASLLGSLRNLKNSTPTLGSVPFLKDCGVSVSNSSAQLQLFKEAREKYWSIETFYGCFDERETLLFSTKYNKRK